MCGISGIISRQKLTPDLKAAATRMSAAQIHRGPDGAGEFFCENLIVNSRRLSIIDRGGGWQPLYNEDKSLILIINGEIYNYLELRNRLISLGHEFRTDTDGEVILHLYEENPTSFIEHLRGMFAFALYDAKRCRLILARDRMGEKPLYLFERSSDILFASELKSLLQSGLVPFELDQQAVNLYFHFQYVPEPFTPIKGVRKLDAATILTIDVDHWRIVEKTYWKMEDAPPIEGDAPKLIRQSLEDVSKLIVRSDVPVGVALSGGLDSSVVAAFAMKSQPDLQAFSVGYSGRPETDERADAEKFAKFLKIPFYDVELKTEKIVEFFPELNFWRDDPIADIAGFGYYAVMRLAHERGVPVILQGQGGDELFWGYQQMRAAARENAKKAALFKKPFSQAVAQSFSFNFPQILSGWREVEKRRANFQKLSFYDQSADFRAATQIYSFYEADFAAQIRESDLDIFFAFDGDWEQADIALTSRVCATYLRENGITQGDRLGMASSVEMRLPLTDYKFVETVIGLRKTQSDSGLPPKFWLREAIKDVLPDWVLQREKKGFAPPVSEWHDALFERYGETLRDGFLVGAGILKPEAAAILSKGELPPQVVCPLSFKALVLEQWCRQMQGII